MKKRLATCLVVPLALLGLWPIVRPSSAVADDPPVEAPDPPEVAIGERLFLETRFAQFFAANSGGNVNAPLAAGDPAVATTATTSAPFAGPFAGQSMNCRQCHLVDEHKDTASGGVRTYGDFGFRTPIPDRGDGRAVTLRNSPPLVNSALPRAKAKFFLHFDGEFTSTQELVEATLTGRNYGWTATEHAAAVAQVAKVLREDDGTGALAQSMGGSYTKVLLGRDASIPADFRLPKKFRVNVPRSSDAKLLKAAARLIAVYVDQLLYAKDDAGTYSGSPYDLFLVKNGLPRKPGKHETPKAYAARLRTAVLALQNPTFVVPADGALQYHAHPFAFGPSALRGLTTMLTRPEDAPAATNGVGNCAACHLPPDFTDFGFHNTGATQVEFDGIHGAGSFEALSIPSATQRKANFDAFLPPTARHPAAAGPFASVPSLASAGLVDLGAWNVLLNPDHPAASARLQKLFSAQFRGVKGKDALLDHAVATFKTSTLRDLGQSAPFLHNALFATRAEVVAFYRTSSDAARAGHLRNADPEIAKIRLSDPDADDLAAFLESLDEDYD